MFIITCIVLMCLQNLVNSENNELLSVIVLFRHGDRAPIDSYKTNPYDESYWPMGYGQLTNIGKLQQYYLGQWFRERYSDFLPVTYSPNYIKVRSSNYDRCLMSASAHLAGLFPPEGDQIWHPSLSWQPIPIHTMPEEEDAVIAQQKYCPKLQKLREELLRTQYFRDMLAANHDLFQYISENTGENMTCINDILRIFNILYIENLYNLPLPEWTRDVYNIMEAITNFSSAIETFTPELARLRAGPLINLIADNFEQHLSNRQHSTNYLILSGHDITVSSLLNSLNISDQFWPEYTATVILELRQNQRSPFINIFYKNTTYTKPLTLNGCDFDCKFDSFLKVIEPLRVDLKTWEKECSSET